MNNEWRPVVQIAAEAGVTTSWAKIALYLTELSKSGKSVEDAASLLRRKPSTIKKYARDLLLDFADYKPFEKNKARPEPRVIIQPNYSA